MKNKSGVFILLLSTLVLGGCLPSKSISSKSSEVQKEKVAAIGTYKIYKITSGEVFEDIVDGTLKLKNQATAISYKGGLVDYLNCNEGDIINKGDLIAKIRPDYNSPKIQSAINARNSLLIQKNNLLNIIQSTAQTFDIQIQALESQKTSLEQQIKILEDSISKQIKQKELTSGDLKSQINVLQQQLEGLTKNYQLLLNAKKSQLDYIDSQITSKLSSLKVSLDDFLLGVDKLFGISEDYLHYNDGLEIYLSAKKPSLKSKIAQLWLQVNSEFEKWESLSKEQKIDVVKKSANLADLIIEALDQSVVGPTLSQSQINTMRSTYVNLSKSFHTAWGGLQSLLDQYKSTASNFDSQLQSLETQINSLKLNINNLRVNKSNQALLGLDLQTNTLQSQLKSFKASLDQIKSKLKGTYDQKLIQLKSLTNQLEMLNKSIKDIDINIGEEDVVSRRDGIVKKRLISQNSIIGPGTPICVVELKNNGITNKVITFSFDKKLNVGDEFSVLDFVSSSFIGTGKIVAVYPTKDPLTHRFLYELGGEFLQSYPEGERFKVKIIWETSEAKGGIFIPLEFLKAQLGGFWVNKLLSGGNIEKTQVEIGEIVDQKIQILSGLNIGDVIVK